MKGVLGFLPIPYLLMVDAAPLGAAGRPVRGLPMPAPPVAAGGLQSARIVRYHQGLSAASQTPFNSRRIPAPLPGGLAGTGPIVILW